MPNIHITIDIPTCKRYKIPVRIYQEALLKEFNNFDIYSQSTLLHVMKYPTLLYS